MKNVCQVTIWLKTKGMCHKWFKTFVEKDMPAAIVRCKSGYAVFREYKGYTEEPIRGEYEIIEAHRGFTL
jgi:hypothetical protein